MHTINREVGLPRLLYLSSVLDVAILDKVLLFCCVPIPIYNPQWAHLLWDRIIIMSMKSLAKCEP